MNDRELVEAAAKAIHTNFGERFAPWDTLTADRKDFYRSDARAALEAVRVGHVVVPRAILSAWSEYLRSVHEHFAVLGHTSTAGKIADGMDARLTPPAGASEGGA